MRDGIGKRIVLDLFSSGWLLVLVAGLIPVMLWPAEPRSKLQVALIATLLFCLGTVARYALLLRRDALVSARESARRLTLGQPDLPTLDLQRPIIAFDPDHREKYEYVWIMVNPQSKETFFLPSRRRWPHMLAIGFDGPALEDLPAFLAERGMGLLAQGGYSEAIWQRRFRWLGGR